MQYYLQDAEICPSERASEREREREKTLEAIPDLHQFDYIIR